MGIFFPHDPNMPRVFLDASVIVSRAASRTGASHALLVLAEIGLLRAVACPYVLEEAERNIQNKLPRGMERFHQLKTSIHWEIVGDAEDDAVAVWLNVIRAKDAPVLAAAVQAAPHRLVTLDSRDFLRSSEVSQRTALKITTPGELMQEIRLLLAQGFKGET